MRAGVEIRTRAGAGAGAGAGAKTKASAIMVGAVGVVVPPIVLALCTVLALAYQRGVREEKSEKSRARYEI